MMIRSRTIRSKSHTPAVKSLANEYSQNKPRNCESNGENTIIRSERIRGCWNEVNETPTNPSNDSQPLCNSTTMRIASKWIKFSHNIIGNPSLCGIFLYMSDMYYHILRLFTTSVRRGVIEPITFFSCLLPESDLRFSITNVIAINFYNSYS